MVSDQGKQELVTKWKQVKVDGTWGPTAKAAQFHAKSYRIVVKVAGEPIRLGVAGER
jgi:hypothetical protein